MNILAEKIPTTVITGFLGAGKTTLVRHLLENAGGRRLALIVNEFGTVGVDGEILRGCGITSCPEENIVELSNGCLCCTVADEFLPTMEALLNRSEPPEHILIETSGLALPKPLLKAFDWPTVRSRITVDGVIAVVDGPAVAEGRFADDPEAIALQRQADDSLDHDNPLEEVYEDQINAADLIIINKIDLMDEATLSRVKSEIASATPRAIKILTTTESKVDVAILLGMGAGVEDDLAARPSHHDGLDDHEHDDFDSFILTVPQQRAPETLLLQLQKAAEAHDILRIKGFIGIDGKPLRLLIQGVGRRFRHQYDRPWDKSEDRSGRIVVIGRSGFDKSGIAAMIVGDQAQDTVR
ncbi:cobalamin biosynthesis protein CobW [Rhodoligotrophos appendicifer]|uniref:cobalamin biosynthesis protein CobW n=1 Tax=Rhodoligotrophos appendicifer TaxID=987056 RepID=UPI0011865227|nr:cobalamin biosynthesis protein CobW [Rhodoligotrophos appendicifer]